MRLSVAAFLLLLLQYGHTFSLSNIFSSLSEKNKARDVPILIPETTERVPEYRSSDEKENNQKKIEKAREAPTLIVESTPQTPEDKPVDENDKEETFTLPLSSDPFDADDEYVTSDGKTFTKVYSDPWKGFKKAIAQEDKNSLLREGDILDEEVDRKATDGKPCWQRWPLNVYYTYASNVNADLKAKVEISWKTWADATCLTFEDITNNPSKQSQNYIKVETTKPGCFASLGRTCSPGQTLNLGNNCDSQGVILHEIGHALGLNHEQSRSDRDTYVRINLANVQKGKEAQFTKKETMNYNIKYDYDSIMHYGRTFFSVDSAAKTTIETIDPLKQFRIGGQSGLSHYDKAIVNAMYNCASKCAVKPTCINGGYIDKNCACVCPSNYNGADCSNKIGEQYPPMDDDCKPQVLTSDGTIKTYNYPNSRTAPRKCVWHLKPPAGKQAKITFDEFNLYNNVDIDYVQVLEDGYNGKQKYTAKSLNGKSITSTGSKGMVVMWRTGFQGGSTGFKATVTMVGAGGAPPPGPKPPPPGPKPPPPAPKPKPKPKGNKGKKKGKKGKKPAAKKPSAKKPSAKKPSAKKPSAKKPSGKKPSSKKPKKKAHKKKASKKKAPKKKSPKKKAPKKKPKKKPKRKGFF